MGDKTKIEWTRGEDGTPGATWNPVVGCTHVSDGCDNCYAAREASGRLAHLPLYAGLAEGGKFNGTVRLAPDRLEQPLKWRKPRRIFVNSMADLFHDSVPDEFIAQVFVTMALVPRHTFQVLTKRHGRMRSLLASDGFQVQCWAASAARGLDLEGTPWPLPNVWLGVSVENQQWADIRIPALLDTPATVRWISAEPLLGPVDLNGPVDHLGGRPRLTYWLTGRPNWEPDGVGDGGVWTEALATGPHLDWVVAGGESGPKARPMHPGWVRSLRDQCAAAGVPFLLKQHGEWVGGTVSAGEHSDKFIPSSMRQDGSDWWDWTDPAPGEPWASRIHEWPDGTYSMRVGKRQAGRLLDGVLHDEYPAVS